MMSETIQLNTINFDRLTQICSELVQIPSINPPGNEEAVGNYLLNFFRKANIPTKIYPVEEKRFNLVAKIEGKQHNAPLAFTGHTDVVPVSSKEVNKWNTPPFSGQISNGFIHGRGSTDMKGGVAAVIIAMSEIVKQNILPKQDIYFIATVDEEDGMKGSKALLKETFLDKIPLIIVCEPTSLKLCTAGKGRTYGTIRISGQTGHGSHGRSSNVIDFMRLFLNEIEKTRFPEYEDTPFGNSYIQVLSVNAGVEPCVIPDELQMKIDARLVPNHKTDEVWTKIDEILKNLTQKNPQFKAEIEIIDKREGWTLEADNQTVKKLHRIYENIKLPFETSFFPGTTDGSVFRRKAIDCLILGPGDLSHAHRENEKISTEELANACRIYFELMRNIELI